MHYYGTRLSENISKREPEGYLLCLNVPVARSGTQEYLPSELGLPAGKGMIPVLRPAAEVFSPRTVASFEGMPVTNDHPPEGVDISNVRTLQKGHAHNVRRGSGEDADLLLADLIITDPALIRAILEDGKREISCGYTYELCLEDGQYIQRQIRGNHVAVVDAGRAGPRVCIKDGSPRQSQEPVTNTPDTHTSERRKTVMKKSLSKVLARMAKDGDVETVAGIIEEMIEPAEEETEPADPVQEEETGPEAAAVKAEAVEAVAAVDEEGLTGLYERLDRIIALLEPAAADEAEEVTEAIGEALEEAAREAADPMAGEISAVMEEILDPMASVLTEPGEDEEEPELPETLQTGDALRDALTAVRPVLARMPKKVRRKMAGDIAARIRKTGNRSSADADVYAALASARRRTAPASAELGRRIMASRNSNYKKG